MDELKLMQTNTLAPTVETFLNRIKLLNQTSSNTLVISKNDANLIRDEITELLILIANLSKRAQDNYLDNQTIKVEIENRF
jgi:hypothetical protein